MTMDESTMPNARRRERLAIAESLLVSPPPLDDLRGSVLSTLGGEVVHASRSRPVVQWTLSVNGEGPARTVVVIGKGFRKGGGEQAWQLLRRLRLAGFDHPDFQVPEPYGFDPARQLLAQEAAPPRTLHDGLIGDPATAVAEVRRVAQWLARLHDVGEVGLPHLAADFERRSSRNMPRHLPPRDPTKLHDPELSARTARALARVDGRCVTTHGTSNPRTSIWTTGRGGDRLRPGRLGPSRPRPRPLHRPVPDDGGLAPWRPRGSRVLGRGLHIGISDRRRCRRWTRYAPAYVARTFGEVLFYRLVVRPVEERLCAGLARRLGTALEQTERTVYREPTQGPRQRRRRPHARSAPVMPARHSFLSCGPSGRAACWRALTRPGPRRLLKPWPLKYLFDEVLLPSGGTGPGRSKRPRPHRRGTGHHHPPGLPGQRPGATC